MKEKDKKPEVLATSKQAQQVVDEVDRITKNIKTLDGYKGEKYQQASYKLVQHGGMTFYRYPEGEKNVDDNGVIKMAAVFWDNEDGSRTVYQSELTLEGTQLTKHTYPPSDGEQGERFAYTHRALAEGDYARIALLAAENLSSAQREHQTRMDERAMGLHRANATEAEELITKLQTLEPAPTQPY